MDRSNSHKKYRSKRSRNSTSSNNENKKNNENNSRQSKKSKKNPKSQSKPKVRSSSAPPKLLNQVSYLNTEISELTKGMGKL
jgi:hypothetical protein